LGAAGKGAEVAATTDIDVPDRERLTRNYPNAWKDFYPSKAPCVFKSGADWEVRKGPEEQGIVRQARTVCRPDIAPVWVSTLEEIIDYLDGVGVEFNSINPLGWANEGEKDPFCTFLLSVGVRPLSLAFKLAVSAADGVNAILCSIGLPEVEVAFIETAVMRLGGPPLLPVDPIDGPVPKFRKPFSALLGLPIAPLNTPYYEGTGGLYLKLDSRDDAVALLTCAHVVRPPPVFPDNRGMTLKLAKTGQRKERMVALGYGGYNCAIHGVMDEIARLSRAIETWDLQLARHLQAKARAQIEALKETAANEIKALTELHGAVTRFRSIPALRTVGWALHSSPIKVNVRAPNRHLGFTADWGLVLVDPNMIDKETFPGNQLYFGRFHSVFPPCFPHFCRIISVFPISVSPFPEITVFADHPTSVFFFFLLPQATDTLPANSPT
jgi:hypothetical protein